MFTDLVKSGLRPCHLVQLVPVSRQTASKWLSGKGQPSRHLAPAMVLVQKAMEAALEDKTELFRDNMVPVMRKYMKMVRVKKINAGV